MEITKMLVLSTQHMSARTALEWMPACPWACFAKADFGWFQYVYDDLAICEAHDVPVAIRSALHIARRQGCGWIMWDCDGPILDELPEHEWGSGAQVQP